MSQLVWQTLEEGKASGVVFTRFTTPVFTFTGLPWMGASFIVTEFPLVSLVSEYFSLRFPLTPPDDVNFCLAIRWEDSDGNIVRRKLWEDISEDLNYPLYNGETILANPVLEIWTIEDSDECSLAEPYEVISGLITQPTLCCQNPVDDSTNLDAPEYNTLFAPIWSNGSHEVPADNFPFQFTELLVAVTPTF